MPDTTTKFSGWGAFDENSMKGNLRRFEYEPKAWDEEDIELIGHEIVGKVTKVGSKVKHIKVGDVCGVGAQSDSCRECSQCTKHREPYCDEGQVGTYAGEYKRGAGKGDKSYGGYSDQWRGPSAFAFVLPATLDPSLAAPMLCAGATVYSPLVQYGAGTDEVKDVGVIGIGGLGHFALLFAKALGCTTTAISHSESKKDAATKLGADRFIATHSGKEDDFKPYIRSLDLIILSSNDPSMPMDGYLSLLRPGGKIIAVGLPEKPLPQIQPFSLVANNVMLGGSCICSPKQIQEMLELAAKQKIHPWIEKRDMEDVNQVVQDMEAGKARFRYVLVNQKNGGKL